MKLSKNTLTQYFLKHHLFSFKKFVQNFYCQDEIKVQHRDYQKSLMWCIKTQNRDLFQVLLDHPPAHDVQMSLSEIQKCLKYSAYDMTFQLIRHFYNDSSYIQLVNSKYQGVHTDLSQQNLLARQLLVMHAQRNRMAPQNLFEKWLPLANFDQEALLLSELVRHILEDGKHYNLAMVKPYIQTPDQCVPAILSLMRQDGINEPFRCSLTSQERIQGIGLLCSSFSLNDISKALGNQADLISENPHKIAIQTFLNHSHLNQDTPQIFHAVPLRRL